LQNFFGHADFRLGSKCSNKNNTRECVQETQEIDLCSSTVLDIFYIMNVLVFIFSVLLCDFISLFLI